MVNKTITNEVFKIKNAINNSDKSILYVGNVGSGKTIVLNELLENTIDSNGLIIDGTVKNDEYLFLRENALYNLYHVCLIIQKILLNIKRDYLNKYLQHFAFFDTYISNILNQILLLNNLNICIDESLYKRPEILIDELLRLISNYLDIKDITIIIDDFDKIGQSSQRYQEFIYERIREYLRLIMTVSDKMVVNDANALENLGKDNSVIKLTYSNELEIVKDILDQEIHNILLTKDHYEFQYRLRFVLSDETILLMIEKTNGNLFEMLKAIRMLYRNINEMNISECNSYILDYIDHEINVNPLISGIIIPNRKLHIK